MIPRNQSDNHERTSERLYHVGGLVDAVYDAIDDVEELCANSRIARIVRVLIIQLQEQVEMAEKAHAMEWVGLGGMSDSLSEAELAEARERFPLKSNPTRSRRATDGARDNICTGNLARRRRLCTRRA